MLKTPIYEDIKCANIPSCSSLGKFLDNIFGQDIGIALRRSKSLHTTYYEKLRYCMVNFKAGLLK